jgi:hypothetical protein
VSRGWAARRLEELPRAAATQAGPAWHPIQHAFGLTAFGANAFVSQTDRDVLVEEHDERGSGQEELYIVLAGRARFTLDGEEVEAPAVTVLGVRDPSVTRSAVALETGTTLLALGGLPRDDFRSTWWEAHFEGVPRLL